MNNMIQEFMQDAEDRMKKTIETLGHDLRAIRTGRAHSSLLDRIAISYYGVPTPVNQVASITAQDGRMLVIKPWDKSSLKLIEKAILESDLNLNPNNDGQVIRLVLPALTKERRQELVKQVGKRAESAKVSIRNIRRDLVHDFKALEKEGEISEDELRRAEEKAQIQTDGFIKQVEQVAKAKEDDILEI